MQLKDFIVKDDWKNIKANIDNRENFVFERKVKGKANRVELQIKGMHINQQLANDIWHGHDYLVDIQLNYHGASGIGGHGYCVDSFENYDNWEIFSSYINGMLICFSDYKRKEKEEMEQMSLFDF